MTKETAELVTRHAKGIEVALGKDAIRTGFKCIAEFDSPITMVKYKDSILIIGPNIEPHILKKGKVIRLNLEKDINNIKFTCTNEIFDENNLNFLFTSKKENEGR